MILKHIFPKTDYNEIRLRSVLKEGNHLLTITQNKNPLWNFTYSNICIESLSIDGQVSSFKTLDLVTDQILAANLRKASTNQQITQATRTIYFFFESSVLDKH